MKKYLFVIMASAIISPFVVWFLLYFISKYSILRIEGLDKLSTVGDAVGGITSPIIGLIGAVLTFLAFYIQYDFNKKQNNVIYTQTRLMMHQNFHELFMIYNGKIEKLRDNNPAYEKDISKYLKSFYFEEIHWNNEINIERLKLEKYVYNEEMIKLFDNVFHSIIDYCFNSEFMYNEIRDEKFLIANVSKLFSLLSDKEIGMIYTIIYEDFMEFLTPYSKGKLGQLLDINMFDNYKIYIFFKEVFK